jgi:hypothetical protein
MTPLTAAKLILAASGLIVWGFGIRTGQAVLQYVGIGLLVTAVLLRFIWKRDVEG